jgi:nucleoside-diphosphate-sugar epimerase
MSTLLLFGASGPVGRRLIPRLISHRTITISRSPRDGWFHGDLGDETIRWPGAEVALSLGPLDAFARWLERHSDAPLRRVIALSSMSAESKQTSDDPHEREVSARLRDAEDTLRRCASARGVALTIVRPTLIYGDGTDRSLAPIARFIRRWHLLPLPLGATGLRQPVHADDLANAVSTVLDRPETYGKTYSLGGGERLPFVALLRRLRDATPGWSVPVPLSLSALVLLTRMMPRGAPNGAAIARLKTDLVADISPAQKDFGYAPRAFIAADVLPGTASVYK